MMEADGEQGQHGLDLDSVEKERLSQSVRNPLKTLMALQPPLIVDNAQFEMPAGLGKKVKS